MRPTELSAIVIRLKEASWLAAIAALAPILAPRPTEAGEVRFGEQITIQQLDTDGPKSAAKTEKAPLAKVVITRGGLDRSDDLGGRLRRLRHDRRRSAYDAGLGRDRRRRLCHSRR